MLKILVLYGTLTGNTETVANQISKALENTANQVTLKNVAQANSRDLEEHDFLIVGASTWDDGKIQDDFENFLKEMTNVEPEIKGKSLAVFGLGDSGYPQFCKSADILEEQFAQYGTKQVIETLKLDGFPDEVENSQKTADWINKLKQIVTA